MARIAYLDHSYHRRTLSTAFLPDILERRGHQVDWFWDEAWQGGEPVEWVEMQHYDVVIMFQSSCAPPARYFRYAHPNVIYIPMLDQFGFWLKSNNDLSSFWEPFQGSKVLNFSEALHHVVRSHGIFSHSIRYFQPPAEGNPREGLHGFFWLRRDHQISWDTIRTLIGETRFDTFHIHIAPDPGSPTPRLPSAQDIAHHGITISTWFEDKSELTALINCANIYFAPRPGEGIGQSFLEAMSRGKCVVAPDQGTMNEYIVHGVNGLLYDLDAPHALNFLHGPELGRMAQQTVREGYERWVQAEKELVEFILTPSENLYKNRFKHATPQQISPALAVANKKLWCTLKRYRRMAKKWLLDKCN